MLPLLAKEISQNNWAMTSGALDGFIRGADNQLSAKDYQLFHSLDEDAKASTLTFLGARAEDTYYSRIKGNVGSLFIDGPITPRATFFSRASGMVSLDALTDEFLALEANDSVEKILLVIDSPGGAVKGLSEFVQVVNESKKPVEALTLGLMASAAYWIGSAADKIYSVDTGLIGSIGTILSVPNPDNENVTIITSNLSPNKNMDVTTKEGKADLQRIVDDLAGIMVGSIAQNRGVDEKTILSQYGKGSVFVAEDALIRGMIDGIVSLRDYMRGADIKTSTKTEPSINGSEENENVELKNKNEEIVTMKTLKELRAESSAVDAEVTALVKAAVEAACGKMQAKINSVVPFMTGKEYGTSIKNLGAKVLKGESGLASLEGAVAVVDEMRADKTAQDAGADSDDADDTHASGPGDGPSGSADIETDEDFNASVAEQIAQI